MGGEFVGGNGYMYMYGWVPLLFPWNYNTVYQLYSHTKRFWYKNKNKKICLIKKEKTRNWVSGRGIAASKWQPRLKLRESPYCDLEIQKWARKGQKETNPGEKPKLPAKAMGSKKKPSFAGAWNHPTASYFSLLPAYSCRGLGKLPVSPTPSVCLSLRRLQPAARRWAAMLCFPSSSAQPRPGSLCDHYRAGDSCLWLIEQVAQK